MKRFLVFIFTVLLSSTTQAQSLQKMSFQAVIRNSKSELIVNQQIGLRISILQGNTSGEIVYSETLTPTTNDNGLISVEIGGVGNGLEIIDWVKGPYFIKTETDLNGGSNYTITGVTQILSVPYALHARTAEYVTGEIAETDPVFSAWDRSAGIAITESQITDLKGYLTTITGQPIGDLSDVDLAGLADGKQLRYDETQAKWVVADETDPIFSAWDRSDGISINESQILDFQDYITDITNERIESLVNVEINDPKDKSILKYCKEDDLWKVSEISDGLSAYDIWLSLGNEGSIEDFVNSLKGPKGDAGKDGRDAVFNGYIAPEGSLKNIKLTDRTNYIGWAIPKWMDDDGVLYGNGTRTLLDRRTIYKSSDAWNSIEPVISIPDGYGVIGVRGAVLVSKSGRIIACTEDGHIFVSDINQTYFPETPNISFQNGYVHSSLAHTVRGENILLGSYGLHSSHDGSNPPREVWFSNNNGDSFNLIWNPDLSEIQDPTRYHIHDVEFDPFNSRIWITIGDRSNTQHYYTDNYGEVWNNLYEYPAPDGAQATQLISTPNGLFLGSDSRPNRVSFLPKSKNAITDKPNSANLVEDYMLMDGNTEGPLYIAVRRWLSNYNGKSLILLPWAVDFGPDFSKLWACYDGVRWFEIYRHHKESSGFMNIIGPFQNDEEGWIYGIFMDGSVYVFKAQLPKLSTVVKY